MVIRTGFIGLGMQGKPIAAHLAPAGLETVVYDLVEAPVREVVATGARAARTPREVGEGADVIGICVPEDDHVRSVLGGNEGVLAGAAEGTVVLVHSTVQPDTIAELAETAAAQGVRLYDACVSGSDTGAAARKLTYMVGGNESELTGVRPYFEATTDLEVLYCGAIGNGCRLKLALNTITYIEWAAAFESAQLAVATGLPIELLEKAGRSNGQLTPMMQAYLDGIVKATPEQVGSKDMQAYLRRNLLIAEKDLAWALALARRSGITMPVAGLISQHMARLYRVEDEGRR